MHYLFILFKYILYGNIALLNKAVGDRGLQNKEAEMTASLWLVQSEFLNEKTWPNLDKISQATCHTVDTVILLM